jgi:CheY-like chemotaxis protein
VGAALTSTLQDAGHCVYAAYDGLAALELVTQLPNIDLLVTNTRLGTVDNAELIRQARELRPDLPILHVVRRGGLDGSDPPGVITLQEPFTSKQLLAAVGGLVR